MLGIMLKTRLMPIYHGYFNTSSIMIKSILKNWGQIKAG
ncbi:hypothetical protein VHP8226_01282 [Vibrio hippocampi]|uniref:Uncharacterized protein n=1 Tax=Vibrio hippocampi TaxID=654686 RepID=A0ABN8DKC5_9VIBR|nr:hypothetical protein VHP8226_01282 [Vibrio hippocampi]